MSILRILSYPDPRLKTVATVVEDFKDQRVQDMISNMLETLLATPRCGGLAATQLDIQDPKRIFVFYDDERVADNTVIAVNPEIISMEGEVFEEEGCMSVYPEHFHCEIHRPAKTKIKAYDRHGVAYEIEREGYLAKLFQHETDHLNGKLYIDRLSDLKRKMADKKITKTIRALKKGAN